MDPLWRLHRLHCDRRRGTGENVHAGGRRIAAVSSEVMLRLRAYDLDGVHLLPNTLDMILCWLTIKEYRSINRQTSRCDNIMNLLWSLRR